MVGLGWGEDADIEEPGAEVVVLLAAVFAEHVWFFSQKLADGIGDGGDIG